MLKLDFYKNKRVGDENQGKIYARAKNASPIGLDGLAEHMSHHNTVFSKGVIKGLLADMVDCIRELCLMGQPVKLENLCIISGQVRSKPAADVESFSLDENIASTRLRFTATGDSTPAEVTKNTLLGYTSLAQKVRTGEIVLSDKKGEYVATAAGDGWGDEPLNP